MVSFEPPLTLSLHLYSLPPPRVYSGTLKYIEIHNTAPPLYSLYVLAQTEGEKEAQYQHPKTSITHLSFSLKVKCYFSMCKKHRILVLCH